MSSGRNRSKSKKALTEMKGSSKGVNQMSSHTNTPHSKLYKRNPRLHHVDSTRHKKKKGFFVVDSSKEKSSKSKKASEAHQMFSTGVYTKGSNNFLEDAEISESTLNTMIHSPKAQPQQNLSKRE